MRAGIDHYGKQDAAKREASITAPWQLPNFPWHSFCAKPLSILFVDRNKNTLLHWQESLHNAGHQPFIAVDTDSAMEVFHQEKINIVVVDLHCVPMDGMTLLRALRRTCRDAGIIVVTDDRRHSLPLKVFREGADDFLLKPFSFITLMDAIERCHNMREEERLFQKAM